MLEEITISQIMQNLGILGTLSGVLIFLAKIYKKVIETNLKMERNDRLTTANLKANKVMLNHFIEKGEGNGEFKQARDEIDEMLIERKVS